MAFQIFYIFINVSVIAAPLISGTLGEEVGWHYGFGCAGVVMVLGLFIYLWGRHGCLPDLDVAARPQGQLVGRAVAGSVGIAVARPRLAGASPATSSPPGRSASSPWSCWSRPSISS